MGGEIVGVDQVLARLDGVDALLVHMIQDDEVPPLFAALKARSAGYGRIGARAGSTLRKQDTQDGASISAGGSGSLGAILFGGSEYGGQRKRLTYSRRNRGGSGAHIVRERRTTMMFNPPLGAGYWFWPTVGAQTRGIVSRARDAIEKSVAGG